MVIWINCVGQQQKNMHLVETLLTSLAQPFSPFTNHGLWGRDQSKCIIDTGGSNHTMLNWIVLYSVKPQKAECIKFIMVYYWGIQIGLCNRRVMIPCPPCNLCACLILGGKGFIPIRWEIMVHGQWWLSLICYWSQMISTSFPFVFSVYIQYVQVREERQKWWICFACFIYHIECKRHQTFDLIMSVLFDLVMKMNKTSCHYVSYSYILFPKIILSHKEFCEEKKH